MIRLELHIDTAGDAFGAEDEDEYTAQLELARILRKTAQAIVEGGYELGEVRRLQDVNGNRCGYWRVTDEPLYTGPRV